MRGCNCGTVHEDAHAPGCSGFAVEYHRLTADNALLRADVARLREALAKENVALTEECDAAEKAISELARQVREARAEVARLQDLHTRCAAFDDQPGPSCVTPKAEVARLREALRWLSVQHDRAATSQHMHTLARHEHQCTMDRIEAICIELARLREALEKIEARCARVSEETLEVFQLRHELREVRVTARAALAGTSEVKP